MEKIRKITAVIIGVLLLAVMPVRVNGQQPLDTAKSVSLTVTYTHETKPLAGVEFKVYRIADTDERTDLTLTSDFGKYPVTLTNLSDEEWQTLGLTLDGYAKRDGIAPLEVGKTDENGVVKFGASMKPGLYMVTGATATVDGKVYTPKPTMVFLPTSADGKNTWEYDANVKAKFEFVAEPKPVTVNVIKIWDDKGYEDMRPAEIQVDLLKDGTLEETVTLNEENGWKYVWENLDENSQWTVVEKEISGYTVKAEKEGDTFSLTNTPKTDKPPMEKPPKVPQTGQLWWPVAVLAVCGLVLMTVGTVRKRRNNG